jgi:hypothetical protein
LEADRRRHSQRRLCCDRCKIDWLLISLKRR